MMYHFPFQQEKLMAKPRMTRADRWKKRPVIQRYWAYKDRLKAIAKEIDYTVGDVLEIEFIIQIPKSYSNKKTAALAGEPHQIKPDLDNLVKAFIDCLTDDDKHIYKIKASKYWGVGGSSIYVFTN